MDKILTSRETFDLRKKIGELFGMDRGDQIWFHWILKNAKTVERLEKEIKEVETETDQGHTLICTCNHHCCSKYHELSLRQLLEKIRNEK